MYLGNISGHGFPRPLLNVNILKSSIIPAVFALSSRGATLTWYLGASNLHWGIVSEGYNLKPERSIIISVAYQSSLFTSYVNIPRRITFVVSADTGALLKSFHRVSFHLIAHCLLEIWTAPMISFTCNVPRLVSTLGLAFFNVSAKSAWAASA